MEYGRLDRREFLRLAGTGAAATAGSLLLPGCGSDHGGAVPDRVIVIGAGVAGLTIGNALTTAGMEVVVLEARERLGGRVWSHDVDGVTVDLGGMWISGPDGNPAACVLEQEGIGWRPAEPIDLNAQVYDPVLQRDLTVPELVDLAVVLTQFEAAVPTLAEALGSSATMADGIRLFLAETNLDEPSRRYAEFGLRTQIEISIAESADLVSLGSYNVSNPLEGGEHFPDGSYRGLVDALARGVDVRRGTIVSRVEHAGDGVAVETSNGTYRGSHVVVTVPLGVLKAGAIEFSPALPAAKTAAIGRTAMAELEKVVLRYDDAFWQSPGSGNLFYVGEEVGEFPHFVDYSPYANGEPTLVAFYCGDYGRKIAGMSDEAIANRAAAVVEEIAGESGVPLRASHVTRWKSDPFALGSYLYLPVGSSVADIEALGAPVGDRLLFAGEATSVAYSGYVHGAVLSGIREAERLLGTVGVRLESGLVIEEGCDAQIAERVAARKDRSRA